MNAPIGLLLAAVLAALVLFMPRYGLWARWRRWRAARQRILIEDALKNILEYTLDHGAAPTIEALAGLLGLPLAQAQALVDQLQRRGLVRWQDGGLHLTPPGRDWAVHVLRAHRLWERYLRDHAGLPLDQVHAAAHRLEHRLSPKQAQRLYEALGYPATDPHGDPIPGAWGEVPPRQGEPLVAWPPGRRGRIVHLEDEPAVAYQQVLACGLQVGQVVQVLERTSERVVLLREDGEECVLAPAVAVNVHLAPAGEDERQMPPDVLPLSQLPDDAEAVVVAIDPAVQGLSRRRLLDLGFTPGARVRVYLRAMFGDPRAYEIRGTRIALRNEQAAHIWVRPLPARSPSPTPPNGDAPHALVEETR